VFASSGIGGLLTYGTVFLVLVPVSCVAGHLFAGQPVVARALSRWGHILLPVVVKSASG
jgi:cadmium resistance protein CadD (predicted permease)